MNFLSHLALIAAFFFSATLQASAKNDKIYAFAYGTCFNDSTIYLTSVSHLSIATIDKKSKLLNDRSGYSNQFRDYLDKTYSGSHTCTIFYSKSRKKAEKKYIKLRRFCKKDRTSKLVEIPAAEFVLD